MSLHLVADAWVSPPPRYGTSHGRLELYALSERQSARAKALQARCGKYPLWITNTLRRGLEAPRAIGRPAGKGNEFDLRTGALSLCPHTSTASCTPLPIAGVFVRYSINALLSDVEFSAQRAEGEEGSVSTTPIKKIGRQDCRSEAPKSEIVDGGNVLVFVPRRNCSATAIPCFNSFGDGHLEFHRDA